MSLPTTIHFIFERDCSLNNYSLWLRRGGSEYLFDQESPCRCSLLFLISTMRPWALLLYSREARPCWENILSARVLALLRPDYYYCPLSCHWRVSYSRESSLCDSERCPEKWDLVGTSWLCFFSRFLLAIPYFLSSHLFGAQEYRGQVLLLETVIDNGVKARIDWKTAGHRFFTPK